MRFTADKLRIAKSAVALSLAATVVLGSVITVAAAIQSGSNSVSNSEDNNGFSSKVEYELSNGDLVVTHNNDFKLDVTILDANKITINNGGKSQLVHLAKGTVADALKKADITLTDDEIEKIENRIFDLAFDFEMEYGIDISVILKNEEHLSRGFDPTTEANSPLPNVPHI